MISRKIWVAGKSPNFHTVCLQRQRDKISNILHKNTPFCKMMIHKMGRILFSNGVAQFDTRSTLIIFECHHILRLLWEGDISVKQFYCRHQSFSRKKGVLFSRMYFVLLIFSNYKIRYHPQYIFPSKRNWTFFEYLSRKSNIT